jgi:hypothetical protein
MYWLNFTYRGSISLFCFYFAPQRSYLSHVDSHNAGLYMKLEESLLCLQELSPTTGLQSSAVHALSICSILSSIPHQSFTNNLIPIGSELPKSATCLTRFVLFLCHPGKKWWKVTLWSLKIPGFIHLLITYNVTPNILLLIQLRNICTLCPSLKWEINIHSRIQYNTK